MIQAEREQIERITAAAQRQIWVTFQKEGIHKYPAALTDPMLATGDEYDVSFLGYPHRHIFHFRVWIDVWHNDRDLEFIQFKRWLENLYRSADNHNTNTVLSLDFKSCEMMARDLYDKLSATGPDRDYIIEVSEDGENGALIQYPTHRAQLISV